MPKQNKNSKKLSTPDLKLHDKTKQHITGVIFLLLTILSFLSLFGFSGAFGVWMFRIFSWCFGLIAYIVPLVLLVITISIFKSDTEEDSSGMYTRIYIGIVLLSATMAALLHLIFMHSERYLSVGAGALDIALEGVGGGFLGAAIAGPSSLWFGPLGSFIVICALIIISCLITFNLNLGKVFALKKFVTKPSGEKVEWIGANEDSAEQAEEEQNKPSPTTNIKTGKKPDTAEKKEAKPITLQEGVKWKLPPITLLEENKTTVDSGDIRNNEEIIEKTLANFDIEVKMAEVKVGPTVTQYSLAPAAGVKLNSIKTLQNDLALALSAPSLRMELPIPGKPHVGIEIPNKKKALVKLRQVIESPEFDRTKPLQFAIGLDVSGREFFADLSTLPHLLIAGASGKGKSVAINSLITSLLFKNPPDAVKFIIIDPKKVEMGLFNGIPHLETPVIIDKDKAANALAWTCKEMDRRYNLLSETHKKSLDEYNESTPVRMPYLIVVLDELADLMQTQNIKQEVESSIIRISQLGRACGIHLIVATQYPKSEVVTGLIKANITARMAFTVSNNQNSRVILDEGGAEDLLGNGDMLFTSTDFAKPIRIQGAFVSGKEVKKVTDFLRNQIGAVIYNDEVTDSGSKGSGFSGGSSVGGEVDDELYEAAKDIVLRERRATTSYIQRRLKIGYNRAANLLELMEEQGVVGRQVGSAPREILQDAPLDILEEQKNENDYQ